MKVYKSELDKLKNPEEFKYKVYEIPLKGNYVYTGESYIADIKYQGTEDIEVNGKKVKMCFKHYWEVTK